MMGPRKWMEGGQAQQRFSMTINRTLFQIAVTTNDGRPGGISAARSLSGVNVLGAERLGIKEAK